MNFKIFVISFLCGSSLTTACQTRIKSPVLDARPLPKDKGDTLIWLQGANESNTQHWIDKISSFLEPYYFSKVANFWYSCSWIDPPPKDKVCAPDVGPKFFPCVKEEYYGYHRETPCIFLTFSEIPKGWLPAHYNSTSIPADMPELLKNKIRNSPEGENKVWVNCEGENPADVENIGPISYVPDNGFPVYNFLNNHVTGYLPPVMAVRFESPARGIVIMVKCTAWANNIPREPEDQIGTVHFELLVE